MTADPAPVTAAQPVIGQEGLASKEAKNLVPVPPLSFTIDPSRQLGHAARAQNNNKTLELSKAPAARAVDLQVPTSPSPPTPPSDFFSVHCSTGYTSRRG